MLKSVWFTLVPAALFPAAVVLALASTVGVVQAAGEGWGNNMDAAMKQAAAEKKDLLLDFTGSDWCGWCVRLNMEVFSKEEFKKEIPKHFVLVELDFPNDQTKLTEAVIKQNEAWMEKIGVEGFPTIVLCKADGTPYAKTGYQPGGPEPYVALLKKLRQGKVDLDLLAAQLPKTQGAQRAQTLDKMLDAAGAGLVLENQDKLMAEAVSLDADGKLGLKSKYGKVLRQGEIEALAEAEKFDQAAAAYDKLLADFPHSPDETQRVLAMKAQTQLFAEQVDAALATLASSIAASPDSELAPNLKTALSRLKAQKALMDKADPDAEKPDAKAPPSK